MPLRKEGGPKQVGRHDTPQEEENGSNTPEEIDFREGRKESGFRSHFCSTFRVCQINQVWLSSLLFLLPPMTPPTCQYLPHLKTPRPASPRPLRPIDHLPCHPPTSETSPLPSPSPRQPPPPPKTTSPLFPSQKDKPPPSPTHGLQFAETCFTVLAADSRYCQIGLQWSATVVPSGPEAASHPGWSDIFQVSRIRAFS